MKTTFNGLLATAFACLFILSSCKKDKKETPTPTHEGFTAEVTAVGTDAGLSNTVSIGTAGGTIVSSDGRLEVIIPAGALGAATQITVQPITNEMSGGAGLAYRLLPDSQQFLQPVVIRFHYNANDLMGTDKRALDIAFQKPNKIWYTFDNRQLDSMAGIVSVNTMHFTDWALYKNLLVYPFQDLEVNVNGTRNLKVGWKKIGSIGPDGEINYPIGGVTDYAPPSSVKWSVNGTPGGGSNNGTVTPFVNSASTVYTAPSTTANMQSAPIAVVTASVAVDGNATLHLPANVKVIDGARYEITFLNDDAPIANGGGLSGSCNWALSGYTDKGHFYITVKADGSVILDSTVNTVPAFTFGSVGSCDCVNVTFPAYGSLNFGSFNGHLEFDGTLSFSMVTTVASPTEVTICPGDTSPVTLAGVTNQIPETFNVDLPTDSVSYVEPWYTLGSMTVKKL